jgi:hydrogenase expression/formation protein HypD
VDEFRDPAAVRALAARIHAAVSRPWTLMEICGGQTHAIVRDALDSLLPEGIELVHGPGCPVCVTPTAILDRAHAIARRPEVVFCTFGDMLRVPGTFTDLFRVKAGGGDVRIVYSPMDALALAEAMPQREVVYFAVGFETTAPANAMAAHEARRRGLENFSMLVSQVRVPPAMASILEAPERRVQGFLAAGHVCAVMGVDEYLPLAARYRVPIVVTGFEPLDILQGILLCVEQLEAGEHTVQNQYARVVRPEGNLPARSLVQEVFEPVTRDWRGIGEIPHSGLDLRGEYRDLDAAGRFATGEVAQPGGAAAVQCLAGEVLRGVRRPDQCPAFGLGCTPEHPLGAPMVSGEGACAAYHRYRHAPGEVPA